ncbi:MAG: GNAT family N-acetyltransferase [Acidimicrobiales bacterium]
MIVRPVRPGDDMSRLGEIVRTAYDALSGRTSTPEYDLVLADVASRSLVATVVGAFADDDRTPLGCITYVPDATNPLAEFVDADTAGFRMLGVDPEAQGHGAGRALVSWCVEQARATGRRRIVIHSTDVMLTAHRLYRSFGFVRDPTKDWEPVPGLWLRSFLLDLAS